MSSRARWIPPLLALTLGVVTGAPALGDDAQAPARRTIYKWVDTNGVAHYTTDPERIPEEVRGLAHELREREGTGEVGAPPASATGSPGADAWAVRDAPPGPVDAPPPESGPAPATAEPSAQQLADVRELDVRISALQEEIARDEERIKAWVSDPAVDPVSLADDPEFREVAARLPRLQADLRSLQEQKQGDQEP